MAYQTLDNYTNVTGQVGLGAIFTYVANIVPLFIPLVLFALFVITGVGSFMFQERVKGRGDLPASFAAASVLVALTSFMFTLIDGLISTTVVVICFIAQI